LGKLFKFLLLQKPSTKFKCFNTAVNTQFLLEKSDENKLMALIISKVFFLATMLCVVKLELSSCSSSRGIRIETFSSWVHCYHFKERTKSSTLRIKKKPKIQHSKCFKNKKMNPKFNLVEFKKKKKKNQRNRV
jgi:hypothetical protein